MSNVKIYDAGELSPLTDVVLLSDHNKSLFEKEKLISKQAKRIAELESIPHTDNTAVIDKLQNHIKELEEKLAMKLDPALHPTCADCDKCSVVISKMETTESKWNSVKNGVPTHDRAVAVFPPFKSWYTED